MAELKAQKRKDTGKYAAFEMRKRGIVPGVLYGEGVETTAIQFPLREFSHLLHEGERVVDLDVDGESRKVMIKDVQHGTFDLAILHADFHAIRLDKAVQAEVEIRLTGEAPGIDQGGMVEQMLFSVEVECLPLEIPDEIEVDITGLHLDDMLHVSDLPAIEGVRYLTDAESPVVGCSLPRGEEEEEEGAEAAEGAAAEPEVIGEKEEEAEE